MPVTNYVWDPLSDNVLLETDENDVTQAVYTQEPDTFGNLISQRRGSQTSYHHFDGLGSTRELTNASETVTDTNMYDAWGVDVASTGTTGNPFRWVGELGYYDDPETDDYYVRARMYQPTIARWLSVDGLVRLNLLPPMQLYVYVSSTPVWLVDPSGEQPVVAPKPSQALLPAGENPCPAACNCKFATATFTPCRRGNTLIPVDSTGTVKTVLPPGKRPDRWFYIGLHERRTFNIHVVSETLKDGCCEYDLTITIGHYRCERTDGPYDPGDGTGLVPCPVDEKTNRGQPWNFALTSAVWVQRTNDTCGKDSSYLQFCKQVIGVHEHTLNDCLSGRTQFDPDWSDTDRAVSQLCDLLTRLPIKGRAGTHCPAK